jgi:hypothetical protein
MVANFRVHEINRGACKLIRTPLLKKKIKVEKKKNKWMIVENALGGGSGAL